MGAGAGNGGRRTARLGGAVRRYLPWELGDPLLRRYLLSRGVAVVLAVAAVTLVVWVAQGSVSLRGALTVLAKTSAFLAISLLALSFVMSTRLSFLEDLFGGLDRQYKAHTVIGKVTLLAVLLHVLFLAVDAAPAWGRVLELLVPGLSFPVTWGILSLITMFVLLALTVQFRPPYGVWKQTHRLMVVPLLLALWHALVAGSDVQAFPALRYWVIAVGAVGTAAYLYSLALYRYLGPRHDATVVGVRRFPDLTEIEVRPRAPVRFHPGQFMFLRFPRYEGVPEMWPFSISSWPREAPLRFSVKKLGDFTGRYVPRIEEGEEVVLMGPYGKFGERFAAEERDMLWVAGGVGITPFLSMARHEAERPRGRRADLVWTYRRPEEGVYDEELSALESGRFRFISWVSSERGRFDGERIAAMVGGRDELVRRVVFLCGPVPMMRSLAEQFEALGVARRDILFEDFDLL